MLNFEVCEIPTILKGCVDERWATKTIYNHFENPVAFMEAVAHYKGHKHSDSEANSQITTGLLKYEKIGDVNIEYDTLYKDVAIKVKDKLLARGFTTAMLYATVEFTAEKTGVMSKQRVMLGRRDCYFKSPTMTDGKLFHDIYVNLSYSGLIPNSVIKKNAYALYALTKELARLIPIRVIVVNHVGTDIPTCYSYVLKKFGQPINPMEFLFFTSDSKRTFGWATYTILNKGSNDDSTIGNPENTVSIANFNLDTEINAIFEKISARMPQLLKGV